MPIPPLLCHATGYTKHMGNADENPTWLHLIDEVMQKLEPDDADLFGSDLPSYVQNTLEILVFASAPAASSKKGKGVTPESVGIAVGHKYSMVRSLADGTSVIPLPPELPDDVRREFEGAISELRGSYFKEVHRAVLRCVRIAFRQPLGELQAFLKGFQTALSKGSFTERGRPVAENSATSFYSMIFSIWPLIESGQIQSIASLHKLSEFYFKQAAGDIKTTEKRCKRIKLSFAAAQKARREQKLRQVAPTSQP